MMNLGCIPISQIPPRPRTCLTKIGPAWASKSAMDSFRKSQLCLSTFELPQSYSQFDSIFQNFSINKRIPPKGCIFLILGKHKGIKNWVVKEGPNELISLPILLQAAIGLVQLKEATI